MGRQTWTSSGKANMLKIVNIGWPVAGRHWVTRWWFGLAAQYCNVRTAIFSVLAWAELVGVCLPTLGITLPSCSENVPWVACGKTYKVILKLLAAHLWTLNYISSLLDDTNSGVLESKKQWLIEPSFRVTCIFGGE